MKCKYCGGSLGLEDKVCPHCGMVNELAANHVEDMQHFESEFNTTETDVKNQARKWSGISVRAVVLIIMVILIGINIYVSGNAYRIMRIYRRHMADVNYDKFSKILDKKLENGDYSGTQAFIENNNIYTYETKYAKYSLIQRACSSFAMAEHYAESVAFPNKYGSIESDYNGLSDSILSYYNTVYDMNQYDKPTAKYSKYIDDMTHRMEMMEIVNLGITKEDAANMATMNQRQRQNLINDSVDKILNDAAKEGGNE